MDRTPDNPLLAAALQYAGYGWRVVPLHGSPREGVCSCPKGADCGNSAGKHPRLDKWTDQATADAAAVRGWWSTWPAANVGVALGSASGVVAVDVDPPGGEAMLAEMAGADLPPTWECRTGKGRRLLYAIPDSLETDPRQRAFKSADGLEAVRLQGTGGQCVLPPSAHRSGRRYEWADGRGPGLAPLAPMPGWLLAEMCRPDAPAVADAPAVDLWSPGAEFNRRGDWWADVLTPCGAKRAGGRAGVEYVTRPGKDGGTSATVGHFKARDGSRALYVFSGNWPGLDGCKCYDLFGAYARLFHGGDYAAAAAELGRRGYGRRGPGAARPAAYPPATGGGGPAPPPPEATWPAPIPLDDPTDRVPLFPTDALPEDLDRYATSLALALGCPVDYPACFLLGAAAGLIGATLAVEVKPGWVERSTLYVCVVAPPTAGKTPALSAVCRPLYDEQSHRHQAEDKRPAYVADVTVEKLADLLRANPRGFPLVRDELAGWVAGMDQYKAKGAGSDRQFWLSNWSAEPVNVLRKSPDSPHVFVPYPCVTVVGGVQPDLVAGFRTRDDGFLDRILFSYPAPMPARAETWETADGGGHWEGAAGRLAALKMTDGKVGDDGRVKGPRPFFLPLAADARPVWEEWTGWLAGRLNDPDHPPHMAGPAGKLRGYAARLALVCHALRRACAGLAPAAELPGTDLARGVRLARYFYGHALKVYGAMGRDSRVDGARRVARWAAENGRPEFDRAELWRGLRRCPLFRANEDLGPALRLLAAHQVIRWVPPADGQAGPGRKPAPRYAVNPALIRDGMAVLGTGDDEAKRHLVDCVD